jgi:hypothetical protein
MKQITPEEDVRVIIEKPPIVEPVIPVAAQELDPKRMF